MSNKENKILVIYTFFVVFGEMLHISLDGAPPMYMRLLYIIVHLIFCFTHVKLIPIFISMSMIMQNFSIVFGEFLPATIYFHLVIISYCYFQLKNKKIGDNKYKVYCNAEYKLMLLFSFYVLLNLLICPSISLFSNLLFAFILLNSLSKLEDEYLIAFVKYIILVTTLSSILSLVNLDKVITDYNTSEGVVQRLAWKDSNYTSFFIGLILLIVFICINNSRTRRLRRRCYIISLILIICMLLLISRGSILSLLLACIFYFRKKIFSSRILLYILVLGALGFILYDTALLDGLISRFKSEDIKDGSGRTLIWKIGLDTFYNNGIFTILFGGGLGSANDMALLDGIYFSPHNNFLEFLFNFGFCGLILFIMWWFSLYFRSSSEKKALVIYIMFNCMTICPFIYVQSIWIIIPLILIWDSRLRKLKYE